MNPHPPKSLKGIEFERLLSDSAARNERNGILTMDHYGVTMSVQNGVAMGIQSKPDFEGVMIGGRQFIFEAKVCSGSSFPMTKDKIKPRQVSHLLTRSKFAVPCFLVIHWNARELKRSKVEAVTVAIPVNEADPRWQRFIDAHAKARRDKTPVDPQGSISREESLAMGYVIPWIVPKGCRKAMPDLLSFLRPDDIDDMRTRHANEIQGWQNKWECAVEMAALAEVERDMWKATYDRTNSLK